MPRLLSVNVGLPREIPWKGKTVHTAVWKSPVDGRHFVRRLNVDGDGQGDLAGHGGEHRAVFVYQSASYGYWEKQLGRNDFTWGQFGENFIEIVAAQRLDALGRDNAMALIIDLYQGRVEGTATQIVN